MEGAHEDAPFRFVVASRLLLARVRRDHLRVELAIGERDLHSEGLVRLLALAVEHDRAAEVGEVEVDPVLRAGGIFSVDGVGFELLARLQHLEGFHDRVTEGGGEGLSSGLGLRALSLDGGGSRVGLQLGDPLALGGEGLVELIGVGALRLDVVGLGLGGLGLAQDRDLAVQQEAARLVVHRLRDGLGVSHTERAALVHIDDALLDLVVVDGRAEQEHLLLEVLVHLHEVDVDRLGLVRIDQQPGLLHCHLERRLDRDGRGVEVLGGVGHVGAGRADLHRLLSHGSVFLFWGSLCPPFG